MFSFRIRSTSNSFSSCGSYQNVDYNGVSGFIGWSRVTLNTKWILVFFGNWSLCMAGPDFAIIIKGPIFLWSSFLFKRIVRKFCVDRYALSFTSRPLILWSALILFALMVASLLGFLVLIIISLLILFYGRCFVVVNFLFARAISASGNNST